MTKETTARIPFKSTGAGPVTLLFIHGFLDSAEVWNPLVDLLSGAAVSIITTDLPGMGGLKDDQSKITLERYRDDIASIIDVVSGDVVVVAQSMGSQIAELVAVARPARVRALLLVTPVPLSGVNAPAEVVSDFYALGGNKDAQRNVRAYLSRNLTSEKLDALNKLGEDVSANNVSSLVDLWNDGLSTTEPTSTFAGPVLIVRGESDPFIDAKMADRVAARFKSQRQVSVPGAGHWLHYEKPQAVADLIQDLIKVVGSSSGASDWKGAFAQKSSSAFADAFDQNVALEAATLYKPVVGRDDVKNVMEAASQIYESLEFTEQSTGPGRQYLEWRATAFGGVPISGVTVITRNQDGRIANIAIHHRPLAAALKFSNELGLRLRGKVSEEHFAASPVITA